VVQTDPTQSLNALIERARAAMSGGGAPSTPGPLIGESSDGMIRAEIGTDGRIRFLQVDPKMLRQPLEDLCAHIVTAINAGLDARPDQIDTRPLLQELKAVQEQSAEEMAKISAAFSDALARALPR
jgi:DNA-binding protein YbaB